MAEQYGAFSVGGGPRRIGVRVGDRVLDLTEAAKAHRRPYADLVSGPTLNPLMAAGPETWAQVREDVRDWEPTVALTAVTPHLPFDVADYVDFYSSENHAANVGRIFRPGSDPLPPNWRHGATLRTGDLFASGTVSGPEKDQVGSLLELSWGGRDEIATGAGKRTFLEDGDEVVLRATASNGVRLGDVSGRVTPSSDRAIDSGR